MNTHILHQQKFADLGHLALEAMAWVHTAMIQAKVWNARACQRRRLLELDERMLRDIGLNREQAVIEARKPFWE